MRASRIAAVVLAMLLAGCAQVPTSGPVVDVAEPVTGVAPGSFVRALPQPPTPGMTTLEVVQGFLDAASGFEDDHAVARSYLTPQMARDWRPQEGVRVYGDDSVELAEPSPGNVTMQASQVGAVTPDRQYVPDAAGTDVSEAFGLEQVEGQWRIGRLAQGLLLSRAAAERSYRAFQTYFVARPGGILTPNPLLLTISTKDLPAELVKSLLAGPSAWLAPTVSNAFPEGTTLNGLIISDGVARVDLSAAATTADDLAREEMSAQLVWTLRQVSGVNAIAITVDGQPFAVPGAPAEQPRIAWEKYNPDGLSEEATWYFQRAGDVLEVNRAGIPQRVQGAAGDGQQSVSDPLIGLDLLAVAATDAFGQTVTSTLDSGTSWGLAPTSATTRGGSWDRTGLLWLPDGSKGAQTVTVLGSTRVPVARGPVTSVQISRDGTRALVVAGPKGAGVAYLMRVERTGSLRLTRPRVILSDPVGAAAWSGANQVALLVKPVGQPTQVATVDLALFGVRLVGGPPKARTVAAAPGRQLLSGTADGRIWGFNGAIWAPQTTGWQPRYPG